MPLYSAKNQYVGINAHLQSEFQAHGGWNSFHGNFITFLAAAIVQAAHARGYHLDDGPFTAEQVGLRA